MQSEGDRGGQEQERGQATAQPPERVPPHEQQVQSAKPVAAVFAILIFLIIMMVIIWQLAVRSV